MSKRVFVLSGRDDITESYYNERQLNDLHYRVLVSYLEGQANNLEVVSPDELLRMAIEYNKVQNAAEEEYDICYLITYAWTWKTVIWEPSQWAYGYKFSDTLAEGILWVLKTNEAHKVDYEYKYICSTVMTKKDRKLLEEHMS